VVKNGEPHPPFDLQCSLLSLPLKFETTLETIPAEVPYLRAPAELLAAWGRKLSGDTVRVGLVWSGNPNHIRDHSRSMPFAELAPLFNVPGIRFFSLQKAVSAADVASFRDCSGIIDLGPDLKDFADTAAVIAHLDLVIAVDTAVAHLAGALGKPVWILLSWRSDFRWLLERADSPWYPSARLYRKAGADAWSKLIGRVAADLAALLDQGKLGRRA
jgi:hypothetical protein